MFWGIFLFRLIVIIMTWAFGYLSMMVVNGLMLFFFE
jgi:hypothetical protein